MARQVAIRGSVYNQTQIRDEPKIDPKEQFLFLGLLVFLIRACGTIFFENYLSLRFQVANVFSESCMLHPVSCRISP